MCNTENPGLHNVDADLMLQQIEPQRFELDPALDKLDPLCLATWIKPHFKDFPASPSLLRLMMWILRCNKLYLNVCPVGPTLSFSVQILDCSMLNLRDLRQIQRL